MAPDIQQFTRTINSLSWVFSQTPIHSCQVKLQNWFKHVELLVTLASLTLAPSMLSFLKHCCFRLPTDLSASTVSQILHSVARGIFRKSESHHVILWLKSLNSILVKLRKGIERNQDGGVEGRALTPSGENTRIATSCWTIIDRKKLELTKKDTPHPKTTEKPQWDGRRGAITVKSNPLTAGWVTHRLENTYTTEVHPLEWRFWGPKGRSSLLSESQFSHL